jgi:mitotic spindle assembly checkpoint protein MAD2B
MPSDGTDPAVLDTYQAVVSAFGEFLTVAVHAILYERNIYPPSSFLSARRYNCAVSQNRHPAVCKWITDAVAAVEAELLKVCQDIRLPFRCA